MTTSGSDIAMFPPILGPVFPVGHGSDAGLTLVLVQTPQHAAVIHLGVGTPLPVSKAGNEGPRRFHNHNHDQRVAVRIFANQTACWL